MKNIFLLIAMLASLGPSVARSQYIDINSIRPWQTTVSKKSLPSGYETFEIVSFNVGNAGDSLLGLILGQSCQAFKLCRKAAVESVRSWFDSVSADVLLIQETLGIGQVLGTENNGPLLNTKIYDAFCDHYHCVAWKKDKFGLAPGETCKFLKEHDAGVVSCPLQRKNRVIQFVSVYYPVVHVLKPPKEVNRALRAKAADALFRGIGKIVDPKKSVIAGGDFNTQTCTNGLDCTYPYPKKFYTLFGQNKKGYGEFRDMLKGVVPKRTFYGTHQGGLEQKYYSHSVMGLKSGLDHIFSNVGVPVEDEESSSCVHSACIMGGGLRFPASYGKSVSLDHRAILARVAIDVESWGPKFKSPN